MSEETLIVHMLTIALPVMRMMHFYMGREGVVLIHGNPKFLCAEILTMRMNLEPGNAGRNDRHRHQQGKQAMKT